MQQQLLELYKQINRDSVVVRTADGQQLEMPLSKIVHVYYPNSMSWLAKLAFYLEKIWESPSANDLVIIGHNFGISRLVEYLTNEPLIMETAQLVSINFNELNRSEISAGTGVISYQYYPDPSSI